MRSSTPSRTRELAVDFANTVACPGCRGGDALASTREADRWVRRKLPDLDLRIGPRDLPRLRRFRDDVRGVLAASADQTRPASAALSAVNRAVGRSPPYAELRWRPGKWLAEEREAPGPTSARLAAIVAHAAIDLLSGTPSPRVIRCEGPACVHFLVARRAEQRWCSPTGCGNRARVQRHYRKLRSGANAA
jgi:predicted RNA-binding Zn ribbon-like protein